MHDFVFVMTDSKLAKKKHTRKLVQINIDDCSFDELIMEDVCVCEFHKFCRILRFILRSFRFTIYTSLFDFE